MSKHSDCTNCQRIGRFRFKNEVFLCAGLIKKLKTKGDHYRLCISKYGHIYDFNKEEVLSVNSLLTGLLIHRIIKK